MLDVTQSDGSRYFDFFVSFAIGNNFVHVQKCEFLPFLLGQSDLNPAYYSVLDPW